MLQCGWSGEDESQTESVYSVRISFGELDREGVRSVRSMKALPMPSDRLPTRAGRPPLTVAEIRRRVHALHVHQTALDAHDRALLAARAQNEGRLEHHDGGHLTPVGAFVLAADGTIQAANSAGAALLNQAPARLLGQRLETFVSDQTRPAFHAFLDAVQASASGARGEAAFAPAGAPGRRVSLEGVSVAFAAGRGWRIAALDLTARQRAEAALHQSEISLQAALDALTAHTALLDARGMMIRVNAAWRRFAARNGGGVGCQVGADYLVVCRKALTAQGRADAQAALRGLCHVLDGTQRYFSMEYPCHSPTEPRWFEMRVFHLGGDRPVVLIAHEDITERKQAEAVWWRGAARLAPCR